MFVENIKIQRVGDLQKGMSSSTGKPWANRNLILAFADETGDSYINAVVDENDWKRLGYEEGQVVKLHLRFRTKRFMSGYVSNDIRVFLPQAE